jgi:hypothetical protein
MINHNYTLNDEVFKYAVKKSAESESYLDGPKFILMGGVSVQLLLGDEIQFFRPTDDVDIFPKCSLSKKEQKTWSKELSKQLKEDGFVNKRGFVENCVEVAFKDLIRNLFMHLNCFTPYYYLTYKKRLSQEFERSLEGGFEGVKVRYQHPIDLITNKVDRIVKSKKDFSIPLGPKIEEMIWLLRGNIQDVDPVKYREDLDSIVSQRELNVEGLGRLKPVDIPLQIQGYKVRKDVYDICCVIDASRKKNIDIPPVEFRKALELMLQDS